MKRKIKVIILVFLATAGILAAGLNVGRAEDPADQVIESAANEDAASREEQELDALIENQEDQLEEVEKKIRKYESLVNKKQAEQATLNNQLNIMDEQVKRLGEEINKTEQQMKLSELEIKAIEIKIKEKDIDIKYRKKILSELIRELYRDSQDSTLELLLKYGSLSEYFAELENLSTLNEKTKDVLSEINKDKAELAARKDERKEKFDKMERLKNDRVKNRFYLKSEQETKEELLMTTEGEEEKYQKLLSRFEQQRENILGNLDEMVGQKSGELARVRSKQDKPKKGLASTSWYYSQRDSRWANQSIGMSRTKMANYGCAVTSVAMVLRYHGINIDPGSLAKQKIFYYDLIVWPESWQSVKRSSGTGHGNINWKTIDKELENDNPVIVFVRANGRGAGHYVVVHHKAKDGDYVVHDPYWGSNMYLSSTRENIALLYSTSTSIDQMIIYHGEGGSYLDIEDEEEDEDELKEKCEDSGGDWKKSKKKCKCDDGYELDDGECVKED